MRRIAAALAALVLILAPCGAQAATRDLLVLNTGSQAIFSVSIGHMSSATWSDDLLAFNDVIGVSAGKTIPITFDPGTCAYDVRVKYADGTVVVLPQVDLCSITRLSVGQ